MNRNQALELAHLAKAFADGETLQFQVGSHWWTYPAIPPGPILGDPSYRWRIKPKAPEPMEFWINVYEHDEPIVHKTAEEARQNAGSKATRIAVHFREVTPTMLCPQNK